MYFSTVAIVTLTNIVNSHHNYDHDHNCISHGLHSVSIDVAHERGSRCPQCLYSRGVLGHGRDNYEETLEPRRCRNIQRVVLGIIR